MGATSAMKLPDLPDDHDLKHLEGMIQVMGNHGCQFRTCLEIGAHRGIWTNRLAEVFDHVHAFEPEPSLCQRLKSAMAPEYELESMRLVSGHENVYVTQAAIMDKPGKWTMGSGPHNNGQGWLRCERANGAVTAQTIDFYGDHFDGRFDIDFIKIDTEGAEVFALWGGVNTIIKHRPWIMIEENGLDQKHYSLPLNAASTYLKTMGMRQFGRWNKDKLFGW